MISDMIRLSEFLNAGKYMGVKKPLKFKYSPACLIDIRIDRDLLLLNTGYTKHRGVPDHFQLFLIIIHFQFITGSKLLQDLN